MSIWRNKVPVVALSFWIIKVLSTTVGETGADYLAVQVGLGQGTTSLAMAFLLAIALLLQFRAATYVPWIYWLNVVLVSVVGTQITDLLTQDTTYGGLGIGAMWTSAIFLTLIVSLVAVAQIRMSQLRRHPVSQ